MDKVGSNTLPIKTRLINGKEVANSFQLKKHAHKAAPAYKLDVSDKAKELNQAKDPASVKEPVQTKPVDSSAESVDVDLPDLPSAPDLPDTPDVSDVLDNVDKVDKAKDVAKVAKKPEPGSVEKPAVFFIGGLRAFDFDLLEDGMKSMTDAVDPARYYGWDQKSEMIEEIKSRKSNQPVILVGHGFGGDTAVEIAQELNTLENKFRRVDLLVTLNSIGMNNDFIPQNVGLNKNYLTADNGWLDDSANIALNYKTTKVENFLRPEDHSDLDESTDIQREIMGEIDRLLY